MFLFDFLLYTGQGNYSLENTFWQYEKSDTNKNVTFIIYMFATL